MDSRLLLETCVLLQVFSGSFHLIFLKSLINSVIYFEEMCLYKKLLRFNYILKSNFSNVWYFKIFLHHYLKEKSNLPRYERQSAEKLLTWVDIEMIHKLNILLQKCNFSWWAHTWLKSIGQFHVRDRLFKDEDLHLPFW